jgi:hypothetical protein
VNLVRDSLNMSWSVLQLYVRHMLLRDLGERRASPAEATEVPASKAA